MPKRKKQPDPDVIRLENCLAKAVPSVTITNLSYPDLVLLSEGKVPEWLRESAAWSVSDHPVGAVNPQFQTHGAEADAAERRSA